MRIAGANPLKRVLAFPERARKRQASRPADSKWQTKGGRAAVVMALKTEMRTADNAAERSETGEPASANEPNNADAQKVATMGALTWRVIRRCRANVSLSATSAQSAVLNFLSRLWSLIG